MKSIWQFQQLTMQRLLNLNLVNMLLGVALLLSRRRLIQGIGFQTVAWALINVGISTVAQTITGRRLRKMDDPFDPQVTERETRNLYSLLWINTGLDVVYMLGGVLLARSERGQKSEFIRGNGWGVVLQGMLLFFYDLINALILREKKSAG
jgi:hypothetical protein